MRAIVPTGTFGNSVPPTKRRSQEKLGACCRDYDENLGDSAQQNCAVKATGAMINSLGRLCEERHESTDSEEYYTCAPQGF